MEASEFIRKDHVSCNGCFFQHGHRVTCMDDSNKKLINDLFFRLGKCYDGHNNSIFILKEGAIDTNRFMRAKPKQQKPFPEVMEIYRPHRHFEEKDHRIEI